MFYKVGVGPIHIVYTKSQRVSVLLSHANFFAQDFRPLKTIDLQIFSARFYGTQKVAPREHEVLPKGDREPLREPPR